MITSYKIKNQLPVYGGKKIKASPARKQAKAAKPARYLVEYPKATGNGDAVYGRQIGDAQSYALPMSEQAAIREIFKSGARVYQLVPVRLGKDGKAK